MEEAEQLCDRVVIMDRARIIAEGSPRALIEQYSTREVVELRGRLVEASRANGWRWRSSLSREDSGAGACELMLIESIDRH